MVFTEKKKRLKKIVLAKNDKGERKKNGGKKKSLPLKIGFPYIHERC